jgi:uroporphyrinogen-III decarboxylase
MEKNTMLSSRERMINAMEHKEVDHVPIYFRYWPIQDSIDTIPFQWKNQVKRAEYQLSRGMDDTLLLQPPLGYIEEYNTDNVPGVKSSVKSIPAETGQEHPTLVKEYITPEGVLRHVVTKTEDWIYGDDIFLFSDYNVPRAKEHIIKDRNDIKLLKYLLNDPDSKQMEVFKAEAALLRKEAKRLGVLLEGGPVALGDSSVDLCGMERILTSQMDEPEFVEELLDTLLEWELKRIDLLLDEGIDVLVHMAWYEGTDFWTPTNYRSMLKPRLKQIVDKVHSRGVKFRYILTKGSKPLMEDLIDIGIDCISGIDPIQDNLDLAEVKSKYGDRICLMGGVNSAVMFSQWSDEEIRKTVEHTVKIMSPGSGFILYPVDAIFNDMNWDKVEVLLDAWRKNSFQSQ